MSNPSFFSPSLSLSLNSSKSLVFTKLENTELKWQHLKNVSNSPAPSSISFSTSWTHKRVELWDSLCLLDCIALLKLECPASHCSISIALSRSTLAAVVKGKEERRKRRREERGGEERRKRRREGRKGGKEEKEKRGDERGEEEEEKRGEGRRGENKGKGRSSAEE